MGGGKEQRGGDNQPQENILLLLKHSSQKFHTLLPTCDQMPPTLTSSHLYSLSSSIKYISREYIMQQDFKQTNSLSRKQIKLFIKATYFCNEKLYHFKI